MKARILTALALIPLVLLAIAAPSVWPVFSLCVLTYFVAHRELCKLYDIHVIPWLGITCFVAALKWLDYILFYLPILFVWGCLAAYFLPDRRSKKSMHLATLWIAVPLICLFIVQYDEGFYHWSLIRLPILLLLPLWAGDTAGIFVGKFFGGPKLAPKISPGKTVSGAIGNLTAATLVAWALARPFEITAVEAIIWGVIVGIVGQMGDLFESNLKRTLGKKDSGSLLPGHGGILDRIDSLLFVAPAFILYLMFVLAY